MEKIKNLIKDKFTFEVRDLRNGEWYWVHKWVIKEFGRELKPNGIAVYDVLAGFSNNKTQKAWPSLTAIGDLIGVSRDTAKRSVKKLIDLKIIKRERHGQYHYVYYLLKNPIWEGNPAPSEGQRGQNKVQRGQITPSEGANHGTNNKKEQELKNKRLNILEKRTEKEQKKVNEELEKLKKSVKGIKYEK